MVPEAVRSSMPMSDGLQRALNHIREEAATPFSQGRLFERLMKRYFREDPLYSDRFSDVWLYGEWAPHQTGFDAQDTGIDLVAAERGDGYCAIQCKCYAPATRIQKSHIQSFVTASARDPFTARLIVDTGAEWGATAKKTIKHVTPICQVLSFADLASRPVRWPDLAKQEPEALTVRAQPFSLRPHQQAAFDDVKKGFENGPRGKLIMACGTGKTFTALRIAEAEAGVGGRVLYLVPSISLLQQSMREWAEQRKVPHRYIGICSDTRAGRTAEDATLQELEIPVTTDPKRVSGALKSASGGALTVVFSTYQSIELVEDAQKAGAPEFDLVLCDEAHRTTGIERPADGKPPFVRIHDNDLIRASKRLYMTATPRLYAEGAKRKAKSKEIGVFSMDEEATYGPEFHCLPFSRAVEQDLLSDYRVVILAVSEEDAPRALQAYIEKSKKEVNLTDAAKIVGCWRALQDPENRNTTNDAAQPLGRAIAFTSRIASSKRMAEHSGGIIGEAIQLLPERERETALQLEVKHVDGQHNALDRRARIDWLKGTTEGGCRILSNARCLSEGIDVPALDAVLFMEPRSSLVDIVQAVGRAMRKAKGKEYGYIVLPVAIPPNTDPVAALNDNKRFAAVWGVLRALRSHDDRFDAEINQIDLNRKKTPRVIFKGTEPESDQSIAQQMLPFPPLDLPPAALYPKIVEKCGDRQYWAHWAKDIADIFARLVERIDGFLTDQKNDLLRKRFAKFHKELRASINESITGASAVEMVAQHILTRPVFEALFEGYDFAARNPVARALNKLTTVFAKFGLENETRDLKGFYESVQRRARGLGNPEARQEVLLALYQTFFATAMAKDAQRLGIVYTPSDVVDFILASADHVLRREFGRSISDDGVHILDPFTGTGVFPARLLQSGLIRDADLQRKYTREVHANEIVLLAYYIAAILVEEAFRGRRGGSEYEEFDGIVLTDTFNLNTERAGFPRAWLPGNSDRAERQQELPIQVIVGNPPWSTGQRSSADDNPNVKYPDLARRVSETYASRSRSTLKNSLYDSYKMAIRWASDRIGKQGVVAFVTNGSWIDGSVDSGVRACLADEFTRIWVLNLRGNARTSGEIRRKEGGNLFGSSSRAPVAITILVRNPNARHRGCRTLYRDIGDYLKREEKLAILREAGSIAGFDDWREITPDRHHDWVRQRDPAFQGLYPLGSKDVKARKSGEAVFRLFSNGYKTGRDSYLYNFSLGACRENARRLVTEYQRTLALREERSDCTIDEATRLNSLHLHWDAKLLHQARRRIQVEFSTSNLRKVIYRPYVKQYLYADEVFAQRPGRTRNIFPKYSSNIRLLLTTRHDTTRHDTTRHDTARHDTTRHDTTRHDTTRHDTTRHDTTRHDTNLAICVPGIGATKPFSVLVVNLMPDLELVAKGQCLPRYRYERRITSSASRGSVPTSHTRSSSPTACRTSTSSNSGSAFPAGSILDHGGIFDEAELFSTEVKRVDNITDMALRAFRKHYGNDGITKDDIFDYVYGVLHAPAYRERFAYDLSRALPRIPMAPDFGAFAEAGRELAELHLGYESGSEYPLEVQLPKGEELGPAHCRIGHSKMRWLPGKSVLKVNDRLRLARIPPEAHEYVVNGRTPLEWFVDRYRITKDRRSGIVNDPNGWFEDDPLELIASFKRIVHVSVETVRIVTGLPSPFAKPGDEQT